jgi:hypothetical protein
MRFDVIEGFSRPDWKSISASIKEKVLSLDLPAAWDYAANKWVAELASDLGGESRAYKSKNFFCLSDLDLETTTTLLTHAESAVDSIRDYLKEAAWSGYFGKQVLLLFSDAEDYFAYISYFYPEGTHLLSAGVFLRRGYAHIALPFVRTLPAQQVITHELVHNLLCHLPIPKWLNEGLAVTIQKQISFQAFTMDRELANRHLQQWDEKNIQEFWAGKTYGVPGDSAELSYSLGEILLYLIGESKGNIVDFIKHANGRDAGQDAAINWMNLDLGEVAGRFLGPGNWRPSRKAISDCFKQAKSE